MNRGNPRLARQSARRASRPTLRSSGPVSRTSAGALRSFATLPPRTSTRRSSDSFSRKPASRAAAGASLRPRSRSLAGRAGARSPGRKRRWLAALLLLALAFFWLRPKAFSPPLTAAKLPAVVTKPPDHHATAPPVEHNPGTAPGTPSTKLASQKKLVAPPQKKAIVSVARPDGISRELLLAAVQARAPTLRACPLPPGAPARVSARLRVAHAGELRTVQFINPEPLPHSLAECLRTTLQHWSFKDLPLKSDVEVLVDFLLGA